MRQKAKKSIDTVLTPKSSLTWKRRFYQMHSPISLVGSFRLQRIGSQVLRITWSDFRHSQTKCKEKACLSGSLQSISIKDLSLDSLYRQDSPSSRQHSYLIPSRTTLLFTFLFSVVSFFQNQKCTTSVVKSGFFIRNWGYGLLHFLFED